MSAFFILIVFIQAIVSRCDLDNCAIDIIACFITLKGLTINANVIL